MSLQDRLKEKNTQIGQNTKDLGSIQSNRDMLLRERADLEKQIAEEKKPKLRDEDYGFDKDGEPCIVLRSGSATMYYQEEVSSTDPKYKPVVIVGNILDDLKALQEDVTEFEIGGSPHVHGAYVQLMGKHINLRDPEDSQLVQIPINLLSDFVMKLRQMEATMKRKE